MPPSTIAASRKADSRKTYWSGVTETSWWALTEPATPGQERAAGEGEELEAEDVDAHRLGGLLVLADRDPAPADAAVVQPGEDQDDNASSTSSRK